MNPKTPIKSLHVSQTTKSISPQQTKSSKISTSRLSDESNHQQKMRSLAQFSLVQKIIESSIVNDCEYQNLLIRNKQFELKILEEQQLLAKMKKQYKRANQPIQQLREKITKSKNSTLQKKQYLQKFYHHLDNRLKTNANSNLFGKLQKIQAALIEKYQQQRTQLYSTLQRQQQIANQSNEELQRLRQIRDDLIQKYTQKIMKKQQMQIQKEQKKRSQAKQRSTKSVKERSQKVSKQSSTKIVKKTQSENKKTQIQVKKAQIQVKKAQIQAKNQSIKLHNSQIAQQTQRLKKEVSELSKKKQQIQKQQKLLKTILNIQQQHKKFSTYITNGYKKLFSIKYRQKLCQSKSQPSNPKPQQDQIDLSAIQKQILIKEKERNEMETQIQQRNNTLQIARDRFNQMINEYSQLEFQVNQLNNRNHSGNHKSTRTSYSKGE